MNVSGTFNLMAYFCETTDSADKPYNRVGYLMMTCGILPDEVIAKWNRLGKITGNVYTVLEVVQFTGKAKTISETSGQIRCIDSIHNA
tara:strand:- start:72679 stop:72942 length:264 start_codon:yes stop_codon:yes gene_type:complete